MNRNDFEQLVHTFQRSASRLEQLPLYREDDEAFIAWCEDRPIPFTVDTSPWLRLIADTTAAGRQWSRVHVIERPLSEYNCFRLATDSALAIAGERSLVVERAWHPDLETLREDFWLFDDQLVVVIQYDAEGHFTGLTRVPGEGVDPYLKAREIALHRAVPLAEYVTKAERPSA